MATSEQLGEIEELLERYLIVLDDKQREVDDIRKMHHDVWKESRVNPIIQQHRSGSRVEKQLRISTIGKQSDIDYTFEVTGLEISSNGDKSKIYWKESSTSSAYGKVYVAKKFKEELQLSGFHSQLFTDNVFEFDVEEDRYLLIPNNFKQNVVTISGFDYNKDQKNDQSVKSPSVPGRGAMNQYDVVPCMRISTWPSAAHEWCNRVNDQFNNGQSIFSPTWRKLVVDEVPLWIVPTGNPLSVERDKEFRISFSKVEIELFKEMIPYSRRYYGIAKYIFQKSFDSCDLLSSYHIKTLMFWMIDDYQMWKTLKPFQFLKLFFQRINEAFKSKHISNYFIKGCNIFPHHKLNETVIEDFKEKIESISERIEKSVVQLLAFDLKITANDHKEFIQAGMKALTEKGSSNERYTNGYLTRLLSVITFSLYENSKEKTLASAVKRIRDVFEKNKDNKNIMRIVPMVNATLSRVREFDVNLIPVLPHIRNRIDEVSENAHLAFEAYIHGDYQKVNTITEEFGNAEEYIPHGFGVSVTWYHKTMVDEQIGFIITILEGESRNSKSPRFYIDPYVMLVHLRLLMMSRNGNNIAEISALLLSLDSLVQQLSDEEPYIGKLSYKFSGTYLMHGYQRFPLNGIQSTLQVPKIFPIGCFSKGYFAGNFDLR